MRIILILSVLCLWTTVNALPKYYLENNKENTCGYASCPKSDPNVLNVHLVPHSHDDVGWLKTVDQYYYGSRNTIQKAGVQYILDSVIQALLLNPERRFIYVETAFLWKWWQEQPDEIRETVRDLINTGRLEIIGGAWSMNDEAAVHYTSTIDQFTWGFRKLNDTLGTCARPKIAWQIDPFGHSREMASLFTQFGFDGLFFARLDWRDKNDRLLTKTAETLWQGSPNLGKSSQLFTSVLYNHYSAPPGFCFDILCNDSPIVENKKSPEYNAEERARVFLDFVETQAKYYRSNNIIVTMGDDFNYQDAFLYFTNLDKLIHAVNNLQSNVRLFYSSPSCYVKAVQESNLTWPIKTDDFFPYASDPHTYWNGYFTSRPTSKRFERLGNNFLQVAKQLSAMSGPEDSENGLDSLREAIGIMQHHDAITGTEKQHVADDYARIVSEAFTDAGNITNNLLRKLTKSSAKTNFESCLLLNISQCSVTENNDNVLITVYNPLSRYISHYVRIPVNQENYAVSHNGELITSQILPILKKVADIPGRNSSATHEVVFKADNIPPLGFKVFNLSRTTFKSRKSAHHIPNKNKKLSFDKKSNLKFITKNGKLVYVRPEILYYLGAAGNNAEFKNRSSGAYIFRPQSDEPLSPTDIPIINEYDGPIVEETHTIFNDWISQIMRLYHGESFSEITWIVGPIPVDDEIGKEVIVRYTTNINSGDVFYTDSNGREMIKRIRGYRETFNLTHEEPVSENYYPITSKIVIQDEDKTLSILNDRAQGGASLSNGVVELMVHRRLLRDDAFGVGEALNEEAFGKGLVAIGKHYIVGGEAGVSENVTSIEKELEKAVLLEPWIFISSNVDEVSVTTFSGLNTALPSNVHILTLEPWDKNKVLLRLEHFYEKNEDSIYSNSATVDIQNLFATFHILDIEEMALGANQLKSEVNRLEWTAENEQKNEQQLFDNQIQRDTTITLNPMEIRTFIVTVQSILQ